jgi:pyrroline-5-carboxylate reductase
MDVPLAIIGGGTMARTIIMGGDTGGVLSPAMVIVAEPIESKHESLRSLGVAACKTASEALTWLTARETEQDGGQLLLAVKPQSFPDVAANLAPALSASGIRRTVISILAGTSTQKIRAKLGDVTVIRAMPNTPAQIRQGVTAIALGQGASNEHAAFARHIFSGVGQLVVSIDEDLMDAFTAVAASGPAYVFYLAQAMVEAAVSLGFERDIAVKIVQETIAGSGALLAETGGEPAALIASVKSKGGTTEAALNVLEDRGVAETLVRALTAARDRGRELGR